MLFYYLGYIILVVEARDNASVIIGAAETSAMGFSIFKHDPNGKVADAYKNVAKEVLKDAENRRKIRSEQLR